MDDMSTPIENLGRPMPQVQQLDSAPQQVMDYNEILRTMHEEPQQMPPPQQNPQQMPPPQQIQQTPNGGNFIPPPVVQTIKPQGYVMQPMQQPQPQAQNTSSPVSDVQKDVLIVIVLCVILYNENFQLLLKRVLPSLFKFDKLSSVGSVVIALMVAGGLYVSKSISFKFM